MPRRFSSRSNDEPEQPEPKRTHSVMVRLNDDEHAAWLAAAKADGRQQLGRWVRETVTRSISDGSDHSPEWLAEVARLRAELTRVGNNLNQTTRALNSGDVSKTTQQSSVKAFNSARRIMVEIRDLLREKS